MRAHSDRDEGRRCDAADGSPMPRTERGGKMFCHACGQPLDSDARWCSHCGTVRPSPPKPPSAHREGTNWYLRSAVFILLLVGISIISRLGGGNIDEQNGTQSQRTEPAKTSVVDPGERILNDAKKPAREKYVSKMQDEFRNQGVDATISDLDGDMVIVSDALKLKPDRDRLMRSTFDPAYRKALCTAGFKTVELKSGAIFGDGDTYSLGCPETKEERAARLEAQRSQRQEFVDQLQNRFNSDSEVAALGIHVEQAADELILTSSSAKDVSPQVFRSMLVQQFSDSSGNKLCNVGFRGLRVRTSPSSGGTFISFGCGKTDP